MATEWISPTWRMPDEQNQSKFENYSLNFDGLAKIEYSTPVDLGVVSTFSFWMNIDVGTAGVLFGNSIISGTEYVVYYTGSAFYLRIAGAYADFPNAVAAISTGQWHHVAFVRPSENEVKCYIDSVLTDTITSWNGTPGSNPIKFDVIGRRPGGDLPYSGKIGQIAGFDSALTSPQITALYNSGTPVNPMSITPPPVAYYPLGGGSTGDAGSTAPNPNTLTVPNSSVPSATVFDFVSADGDRILCSPTTIAGTGPINGINGAITISIWLNSTQASVNAYPINRDFSGSSDWRFRQRSDTNLFQLYLTNTSSAVLDVELTGSTDPEGNPYIVVNDGKWHHIVGIYNGTDTAELYTDGVLQGSATSAGFGTLNTGSRTVIGGVNNSAGNPYSGSGAWNGDLSNAQIWDTNLSSSEVTTLYNNGVPYTGTQPQAANLKGWWKMNVDTSTWNGSDWIIGEAQANYTSALNFDGINNVIPIRTMASMFGVLDDVTYSCWIRTSVAGVYGQYEVTFGGYSNGGGGFDLGKLWTPYGTTDLTFPVAGATKLNDGEWHHVATTFNDSTKAVNYYLDGQLDASTTWPAYITHFAISIGAGNAASTYNFTGDISNCVLHDSELTQPQIETLYNNGTPQLSPSFSPYGWWKCDNLTTGIEDSIGSNNGTNNGATVTDIQVSTLNGISSGMTTANLVNSDLTRSIPYSSYSMEFDAASSEYVSMGNVLTKDGSTAFSISCWIKYTGSGTEMIVSKQDASGYGYLLTTGNIAGVKLTWYPCISSGGSVAVRTSNAYNDGNWHNVLATYDGSGNASGAKIYVDGTLDTNIVTDTFTGTSSSTGPFQISARNGTSFPFDGNVSNAAVFNSSLTEDQILTIYNGGVPNDISSLSPVSWWSLAGDSYFNGNDWICPDLGSGGNNGTSSGMGGTELVGNGPGSTANGIATSMNIPGNLKGNAPNSSKNAFSVNMNPADRVEDVAPTP